MEDKLPKQETSREKIKQAQELNAKVLKNHTACCRCGQPIGSMHLFINMVINGKRIQGVHCGICAREVLENHIKGGNHDNGSKGAGEKPGHQYLRGLLEDMEDDVSERGNQDEPVHARRRSAGRKKKSS